MAAAELVRQFRAPAPHSTPVSAQPQRGLAETVRAAVIYGAGPALLSLSVVSQSRMAAPLGEDSRHPLRGPGAARRGA